MPRSVTVRHGFFPMWKGQGPGIKKPPKFPALDEVLGEHDVTQSDLMDIGQTFILSVYSENIYQLHRYNIHRKKPPTLNFLSSRSSPNVEGSRSVSVTNQKQLKRSPTLAGRLQKVRKWWNLLAKLLGVISLRYCGEPPRPSGIVLGLRPPGPEFRILCLEGSVISFISPLSGGFPGPV